MVLILAREEDSLANAVCRVARQSGTEIMMCADADILDRDEQETSAGVLLCDGTRVSLADISGVLFRLPAGWWRTESTRDEHDQVGSWYTLLWNLPCPVVNRYGLSWWFDPAGYGMQLSLHLTAALRSIVPARPGRSDVATAYMAGGTLVADHAEDFGNCTAALEQWQHDTGTGLAKLTLRGQRSISVDPSPDFAGERPEVTGEVAAAVYSMLVRT